jgi:hypothetical protein
MKNRACPVASIANKSLKRIELIVRTRLHSIDLICPKASLFFTAFLTIAGPPADAAVIESWVQLYDGPAHGDDQARAVAVDSSGNVVVTGASYNPNPA